MVKSNEGMNQQFLKPPDINYAQSKDFTRTIFSNEAVISEGKDHSEKKLSGTLESSPDQPYKIHRKDYSQVKPEEITEPYLLDGALETLQSNLKGKQHNLELATKLASKDPSPENTEKKLELEKLVQLREKAIPTLEKLKGLSEDKIKDEYTQITQKTTENGTEADINALVANALVEQVQEIKQIAKRIGKLYEHFPGDSPKQAVFKETVLLPLYKLVLHFKDEYNYYFKDEYNRSKNEEIFREAVKAFRKMVRSSEIYMPVVQRDYPLLQRNYPQVKGENTTEYDLLKRTLETLQSNLKGKQDNLVLATKLAGMAPSPENERKKLELEKLVQLCERAIPTLEELKGLTEKEVKDKYTEITQKAQERQEFNVLAEKEEKNGYTEITQKTRERGDESDINAFVANALRKQQISLLGDQLTKSYQDTQAQLSQRFRDSQTRETFEKMLNTVYEQANDHKGKCLDDQNTRHENERQFHEMAEKLQIMMHNPEKYMKWFRHGERHAKYLTGQPEDQDLKGEILQYRYQLEESKQLAKSGIERRIDHALKQTALNDGADIILNKQLPLKDLERLIIGYHAVSQDVSKLLNKPGLDLKTAQELLPTWHDLKQGLNSAFKLFKDVQQAIREGDGHEFITEQYTIKDEKGAETKEDFQLNKLQIKIAAYENKINELVKKIENISIQAKSTSYEHEPLTPQPASGNLTEKKVNRMNKRHEIEEAVKGLDTYEKKEVKHAIRKAEKEAEMEGKSLAEQYAAATAKAAEISRKREGSAFSPEVIKKVYLEDLDRFKGEYEKIKQHVSELVSKPKLNTTQKNELQHDLEQGPDSLSSLFNEIKQAMDNIKDKSTIESIREKIEKYESKVNELKEKIRDLHLD